MRNLWKNIVACLLIAVIFVMPISALDNKANVDENEDCGCLKNSGTDVMEGTDIFSMIPPNHEMGYVRVGWRIREYLIHLPANYEELDTLPLVITLHGSPSNGSAIVERFGISEKADEMGFIAVYPDGIQMIIKYILENKELADRSWNVEYCCPPSTDYDIDDVMFIRELIEKLQQKYKVDPNKIYMAGHSNGAMMAYRLASELSDVVAAVAPNAGPIGGQASKDSQLWMIPEPNNPVSVIHFHGKKDPICPYEGGKAYGHYYPDFMSVNESIDFWVQNNGCDPEPEIHISESGNIIRRTYTNGDAGTEVVLYTDIRGGHYWFGEDFDPYKEMSTTDLMLDFFMQHPKQ